MIKPFRRLAVCGRPEWLCRPGRSHGFSQLCLCGVPQSCLTLCNPMECSPPCSSAHGNSLGKNTGVGCRFLLQGNLPNSGIEPWSPALQADSLWSEPPGKPKNTGLCSISLLQGGLTDPGIKPGSPALQAWDILNPAATLEEKIRFFRIK